MLVLGLVTNQDLVMRITPEFFVMAILVLFWIVSMKMYREFGVTHALYLPCSCCDPRDPESQFHQNRRLLLGCFDSESEAFRVAEKRGPGFYHLAIRDHLDPQDFLFLVRSDTGRATDDPEQVYSRG